MRKLIPFSLCAFCLIFACQNDLEEIDKMVSQDQVAIEQAKDVTMLYSDSAVVRVQVEGATMLRHLDPKNPRQEFTDGVKVVFFTPNGRIQSTLTAKYAVRMEKQDQIIVRDSVVWDSFDGEKLETNELIWEERKEKVYTKKFVKITKPDEVIYGIGFEANQDFTHWKINAVEGELKVKDNELKN